MARVHTNRCSCFLPQVLAGDRRRAAARGGGARRVGAASGELVEPLAPRAVQLPRLAVRAVSAQPRRRHPSGE